IRNPTALNLSFGWSRLAAARNNGYGQQRTRPALLAGERSGHLAVRRVSRLPPQHLGQGPQDHQHPRQRISARLVGGGEMEGGPEPAGTVPESPIGPPPILGLYLEPQAAVWQRHELHPLQETQLDAAH